MARHPFRLRLGQVLEIAVYRTLLKNSPYEFFGAFLDLDEHDDSTLYAKEEPPTVFKGTAIPGKKRLDFLLLSNYGRVGIEAKNIREWLYPHSTEISQLLLKCCAIDAVPVLIARRIPYVTFQLLRAAGMILHQTLNQRFAVSDTDLANLAKDKDLLGYHDIRVGNEADDRLLKFVGSTLQDQLPQARQQFDSAKKVLARYSSGQLRYDELAAYLTPLVRRQK